MPVAGEGVGGLLGGGAALALAANRTR